MKMRKIVNLDTDKLEKEDRRFLLQKNSSEILYYEQSSLNNYLAFITLLSILISGIALITSLLAIIPYGHFLIKIFIILIILIIMGFIFLKHLRWYKNSKNNIRRDKSRLVEMNEGLSLKHFDYAISPIQSFPF